MSGPPQTFRYCPDPVFVIGSPRSGTTALARALGTHGAFFVGDETFFLWELFAQRRLEEVFARWAGRPSSSWLRREGVAEGEFLAAAGLGINALFTSRAGERRWVDHTPHHCHMADTLAGMFPGARFVHVLRDGREVVNSMIHVAATLSADEVAAMREAGFLPPWAHDFHAACSTWRDAVRAADGFATRCPDRVMTVVHRDLEREPERVMGTVLRFLVAADEPGPAAFLRRERINSSFTPPGGVPAGAYRRPDPWAGWSAERRALFRDVAGAEMERLGLVDPGDARGAHRPNRAN